MNIVVTSPKDTDLMHKLDDIENSFWTLHSKPKNFKAGEVIWIVKDGDVVGGFYVRQIEKISKALEDAEGHNPSQGYRFWFDSEVSEDDCVAYGVLSEHGDFLVKVRGFQGFRYQWWKEKEAES
jgi:hypothetical protein